MTGTDDAPSLNGSSAAEAKHTEVEDEDGYLRQRRLKAIHEARERVHDAINEAEKLRVVGEVPDAKANSLVRSAVENYIREIRYPLKNTTAGTEYWTDEPIGSFQLTPPSPATLAWRHKKRNDVGHSVRNRSKSKLPPEYSLRGNPDLSATTVTLTGLKSLFDVPEQIVETYELKFHIRFEGTVTIEEPVSRQLPRRILHRYFDAAIEASGEIGLEASLDEAAGDRGFDVTSVEDADFDLDPDGSDKQ